MATAIVKSRNKLNKGYYLTMLLNILADIKVTIPAIKKESFTPNSCWAVFPRVKSDFLRQ